MGKLLYAIYAVVVVLASAGRASIKAAKPDNHLAVFMGISSGECLSTLPTAVVTTECLKSCPAT